MPSKKSANPLWGGHFSSPSALLMEKINASIDFDKRLYKQDIRASIAHVKMLAKTKIISSSDKDKIIGGLEDILGLIDNNKFEFSSKLEDIHMNIEAKLKDLIGPVAGKLHTARSRNDQVATDFKIYVREANSDLILKIKTLINSLLVKAEDNIDIILPGYTHLQTAQPILLAHHFHAYIQMLIRDLSRFSDANARLDELPLGSAALAGTSFPIDRKFVAKELDFNNITANSLDTVSDRDFALDFLSNCSIIMTHISRLAEELILWMSREFSFVPLSENYTTGSSIMPQKRNPDAAELVRGKSGRIYGNLMSLLTVMKALPLAYSKDMQEDKEPVFDSYDNLSLSLDAMSEMIKTMKINSDNMYKATLHGYITATDLADYLVKNLNIPFRDAHHITGQAVKMAETKKCRLDELTLAQLRSIEPGINDDVFSVLDVKNSINSRKSLGGTAPEVVSKALELVRKKHLK